MPTGLVSLYCHLADDRTAEDSVMHVTLTKLQRGETWPAVLKGHELDPLTQQQDQQRLLLERFQREVSAVWGGVAVLCTSPSRHCVHASASSQLPRLLRHSRTV